MHAAFDYAILRLVPRVEREEFLNIGVAVFCHDHSFLEARFALDNRRVTAFAPSLDLDLVMGHLDAFVRVCRGEGSIGALPLRERWHWLVAPRSTILQTSPPHVGLCTSPQGAIEVLLERNVR